MGSKFMSAVSRYVRDQTYTKDVGVKVCSAASTYVESVVGNCWRSGAELWHSQAVLEHTEKVDF